MKYCMNCGAELGEGRFCTNCGTPVGSATPPVEPTPAYGRPTTYRLPDAAATTAAPAAVRAPAVTAAPRAHDRQHWSAWLVLVIGLVAAVLLGSFLARGGDRSSAEVASTPTPSASTEATAEPTPLESGRAGTDLARDAEVTAPAPIRPGTDISGKRVPYPASNMLDGSRDSAYRLAGDATGTVIRFDFGADKVVSAVGLVNGYAKVDEGTDWYPLNRRIETVEWRFADGTTLLQQLVDTDELQAMQIVPETTSWIEMRLVRVSAPGDGRRGKDTTAISDVLLLGG